MTKTYVNYLISFWESICTWCICKLYYSTLYKCEIPHYFLVFFFILVFHTFYLVYHIYSHLNLLNLKLLWNKVVLKKKKIWTLVWYISVLDIYYIGRKNRITVVFFLNNFFSTFQIKNNTFSTFDASESRNSWGISEIPFLLVYFSFLGQSIPWYCWNTALNFPENDFLQSIVCFLLSKGFFLHWESEN